MLSLRAIDNLVLLKRKIVSYDERNLRAENGKELAGREGWGDSDDTKRISEKERMSAGKKNTRQIHVGNSGFPNHGNAREFCRKLFPFSRVFI